MKPSAPELATAPSVSTPTSVQMRKKSMSKRPKCFLSFDFSSTDAAVSEAIEDDPLRHVWFVRHSRPP